MMDLTHFSCKIFPWQYTFRKKFIFLRTATINNPDYCCRHTVKWIWSGCVRARHRAMHGAALRDYEHLIKSNSSSENRLWNNSREQTYLLDFSLPGSVFRFGSTPLGCSLSGFRSGRRRGDGGDDGRLHHPLQIWTGGDRSYCGDKRNHRSLTIRPGALRSV